MLYRFSSAIILLAVLSAAAFFGERRVAGQEPSPRLVDQVDVEGNRRLRDEDVLYHIQTRAGDPYNEEQVRRDLQALLGLPYFDKTATRVLTEAGPRGGVNVIFEVSELPIVRDLTFKGLSSIGEADVLKAFRERRVGVSKEVTYDPARLNGGRRVIKELLAERGHPNATIEVESEEVSPTSVAVHYEIDEGDRVRVVEIDFDGNQQFSDGELRGAMKLVKEAGLISRFKGQDILHLEKLDYDLRQNVISYMRSKGYLEARTGEPRVEGLGPKRTGLPVLSLPIPIISSMDEGLRVTVPVIEGKLYRLGEIKIEGNSIFSEQQIKAIIGLREGEVADGARLGRALYEDLKRFYGSQGFIQYTAEPEPSFRDNPDRPGEGIADFNIAIEEGKQFSLRRLEFLGNTFTRDNVLRREVLVNEGDVYSESAFEHSVLRLNQLGYFDPVDKEKDAEFRTNDETGEVDVNVRVSERGRQQISFNGGAGGSNGSSVGLEYSTNNLLGRGESLSFSFAVGDRQRSFVFSFTEPYVRDRPISAGFSIFKQSYKYYGEGTYLTQNSDVLQSYYNSQSGDTSTIDESSLFTQETTGASVFVSAPLTEFYRRRPFTRFSRIGLNYSLSRTSVKDPEVNSAGDSTTFIPVIYNQSNIVTSRATGTFVYDTRNGSIDPTGGKQLSISFALAGLGGDVRTYQPVASYTSYTPVRNKRSRNPHVFAFRVVAGHVGNFGTSSKIAEAQTNSLSFISGVPVYERFYLGGEDTIRGYNTRSVTPVTRIDTYATTRNIVVASNSSGTAEAIAGLPQSLADRLTALGTFTGTGGSNSLVLASNFSSTGGDTQLLGNFEYRVPVVGNTFSFAAFADVGSVFNLRKTSDQTYSSSFIADDPYLSSSFGLTLNSLVAANNPRLMQSASTGGIIIRDTLLVSREEFNNALRVGPTDPLTGLPVGFQQVFVRGEVQTNSQVGLSQSLFSSIRDYRSSVGLEMRLQLPIINAPFRLIYAINPNSRNGTYEPGITFAEDKRTFRFSIGRTF